MSTFDYIDTPSGESFDVIIEVDFEKVLNGRETVDVLNIVSTILTSEIALIFFEELFELRIDAHTIFTRFRYRKSDIYTTEDVSRQKVQFIFYLFASIDAKYRLGNVPFPPSFRKFISLPEVVSRKP